MPVKSSITSLLIICTLLAGMAFYRWPDEKAYFIVCDVGQGDAILLIEGFVQVLIDGGRDAKVMDCLNAHIPFWDKRLELMVATHPDADHIAGLTTVLQTYRIDQLLMGEGKQTADFEAFKLAVQKEALNGMKITNPTLGTRVSLGPIAQMIVLSSYLGKPLFSSSSRPQAESLLSAQFEVNEEKEKNYNDESIVLFLRLGQAKILLTGDMEIRGEQALLNQGVLAKMNVLKVGHHGSKSSTSWALVTKIQPEFSLISVGENNTYGHPHAEVLTRLTSSGSHIKRTDLEGDIILVADHQTFWFQ